MLSLTSHSKIKQVHILNGCSYPVVKTLPTFMEHKSSLPCSRKTVIGSCILPYKIQTHVQNQTLITEIKELSTC